ncbi:MAG: phosphotransferase [Oscillospiraceae bacterium]|nr:phosphotransferase [Oscillospiraceae bacterium]
MNYQELKKNSESIASTARIEVLALDELAYKLFHKSYSPHHIYREAMLQCMAAEAGINVPKIHGVIEVDDRLAIVSDYIEGDTVAELMDEFPAKKDKYLALLADTQLDLLSRTVNDVRKLTYCIGQDIDALTQLDEVKRYELETLLASMPDHDKLCHGNFGPENVMIDGMDRVFILDWNAAAKGNAGADMAKTYLKLTLTSTEDAEKYIRLLCEKTGYDRQYIYEWVPLMAASCLNEKGFSEKEKEALLTWIE